MNVKHYCRFCLSEDFCEDMCIKYCSGDRREVEVYFEMLLSTFNIDVKGESNCLICEVCITKLKEAASFKEQILNAQENIRKFVHSKHSKLKIEDDNENTISDNSNNSHFMWDVIDNTKMGQSLVKNVESIQDSDKTILEETESLLKNLPNTYDKEMILNVASIEKCGNNRLRDITEAVNHDILIKKKILQKTKGKPKKIGRMFKGTSLTQAEMNSRENTLMLIQNSNLCLFRSLKTKFGCFMCKMAFVDAVKLREHSLTHTNTTLLAYKVNKLRGLSFKNVDISRLKCNKCSQDISDLPELMSHLRNNHDIKITGTNHFLIPYKLAAKSQCVLCDTKFNSFLRLSIHMNSHYRNNVCEICGLPFINRKSLRTHVQSMHKEKKCSLCPAKFLTVTSKVKHLKKVHNYFNSKRHCNLCDKTFKYTYMLNNHKIEEHGTKKTVVNCDECGKTFFNTANLRIHVRSVHIRERNYQCEVCGTRFFTKSDQKRHERTHNDVRSFCCSYCEAKFKSNDSRRRHMKRQHGHVFS